MYQIGDHVKYAAQGICQIVDIRPMKVRPTGPARPYYVLQPIHQANAQIFVPVENQALAGKMRPILSAQQVDSAIARAKEQQMAWIPDRKARTTRFQQILLERNEEELILLIRCLRAKAQEPGKGLSSGDAEVLRQAEGILFREFAFSLQMSPASIDGYIRSKMA